MRTYTVHRPGKSVVDPELEAEQTVFIKEGFCWPALFVPMLWFIYHRMWLPLLGYIILVPGISGLAGLLDLDTMVSGVVVMALQFLLAAEGGDLRRWVLARRGYEMVQIVHGPSMFEAETGYFTTLAQNMAAQQAAATENQAEITFRLGVPSAQIQPQP